MDINGAKALKERLGPKAEGERQPARADLDLPEDAPPVYQWLGVSRSASSKPPADDDETTTAVSLFHRLGLNFR